MPRRIVGAFAELGRIAVWLGTIALTVWLAHGDWWMRAKLQLTLLRAQRHCMDFQAPADQVVYECDPAAAALLLRQSGYASYARPNIQAGQPLLVCNTMMDKDMQELYKATAPVEHFYDVDGPPNSQQVGAFSGVTETFEYYPTFVFVHRLRSARGERLVAVRYDNGALYPMVWKPAGWFHAPVWLNPGQSPSQTVDAEHCSGSLELTAQRVFAGQPDADDSSRFTIEYQRGIVTRKVRGQLLTDDTVRLVQTDGDEK